jgi:hypothetical protein
LSFLTLICLIKLNCHGRSIPRQRETFGLIRRTTRREQQAIEFDPASVTMASLPLDTNVLFMTVMANKMPFVGRG